MDQVIVNNKFTYTKTKGEGKKYIHNYNILLLLFYITILSNLFNQQFVIVSLHMVLFGVEKFWMAHPKPSGIGANLTRVLVLSHRPWCLMGGSRDIKVVLLTRAFRQTYASGQLSPQPKPKTIYTCIDGLCPNGSITIKPLFFSRVVN